MKVSVITVCLNCEKTIEKTLKSVSIQTYSNIEHIVLDGLSTDNTSHIVQQFEHVTVFKSQKDNGVYFALNNALDYASGDIIGFLHADDFYNNEFVVEQIVKIFEVLNADIVYGDLQYVSDNYKVIRYWKAGNFRHSNLFFGWMPPHPTVFFRKDILSRFGKFDTNFRISADYDWVLRVFTNKLLKIAYFPEIVVNMTIGGISNRSLSNIIRKSREDLIAIKKNRVGNFFTLIMKNLRKISQFYKRKNI